MKGGEGLYWVPAVPFNGSKTAEGIIWDLGALNGAACGPELVLGVGAAGVVVVQSRDGDRNLPLTPVGRNSLSPSVISPSGGFCQYKGKAWEGASFPPWAGISGHLSCPVTLKTCPTAVHCAAEHPCHSVIPESEQWLCACPIGHMMRLISCDVIISLCQQNGLILPIV